MTGKNKNQQKRNNKTSSKNFHKSNSNRFNPHKHVSIDHDDGYRYSPRLSTEEREQLSRYPHILDEFTFSEEQLQQLERDGYLVIKNVISAETCDKLIQELFAEARKMFGIHRNDPQTWTKIPFHGCINIWHTKTLNNVIRQHPVLYSIFAQLLKTSHLTVSVDRFGMKPPCPEDQVAERKHKNENIELHTDLNYWQTNINRPQFQGGFCLQDCPRGGGGFFVLPGFHNREEIRRYMNDAESGKYGPKGVPKPHQMFNMFRDESLTQHRAVEVPMEKGDFVIWNNLLPHTGGVNELTDHWRLHCFVRFISLKGPCCHSNQQQQEHEKYRDEVLRSIDNLVQPERYATLNPVRSRNSKPKTKSSQNKVHLTSLGNKLLGLEEWTPKNTN